MSKIYRTNIDLRVLSDEIKIIVFASGSIPASIVPRGDRFHSSVHSTPKLSKYNKQKCLTISFDTNYLAEILVENKEFNQRMFLILPKEGLNIEQNLNVLGFNIGDLRLEIFKNSSGYYGFEQVNHNAWGTYLSHKNYYNTSVNPNNPIGQGALELVKSNKGGVKHQLQMMLPGVKLKSYNLSFDIDILIERGGQYTHSLIFKNNLEDLKLVEGDVLDVKPVTQITTTNKNIKLNTTYLKLTQKDLASREVIYDYKTQLTPQNIPSNALELVSSEVYAVQNYLNLNVNLSNINLTDGNIIQIPYNISRVVENNKIKPAVPITKDGKEIYELNWVTELLNNDIVKESNKCINLKFSTEEQLKSFEESLKKQQIGMLEKYPILDNGRLEYVKRTYSSIEQWVNRSQINQFNDASFVYNSDGKLESILICPTKQTNINNQVGELEDGYTEGGEYTLPNGEEYVGYYHIHPDKGAMVGAKHSDKPHDMLMPIYNYAPISANSKTDFLFTTFDKSSVQYSAFTATTNSRYEFSDTYDVRITGATFSAKTTVPISNVKRKKPLPLINDKTKKYGPYVFPEAYEVNNGVLILNENNPTNYLKVSGVTNGVYRFSYEGFLNVNYTDSQWCEYLTNSYPSGTTGNYPSSNYEIKRLINTSIIKAGMGEKNTVLQDTGFKYYPGRKFRDDTGDYDVPPNTGILEFDFKLSLIKTSTGGTETNLKTFTVKRCKEDGSANNYLTLEVVDTDVTSSGSNVCILSGVSASTIFTKQIPISLDTGLINISSGETIHLEYDSSWVSTSKGGYFGLSNGETNLDLNLGHQLDDEGNTIAGPWFRGIKSTERVVTNNLFFDSAQESKPFKMFMGGSEVPVKMNGALYLTNSNNKCDTVITPIVDSKSFSKLAFVDTKATNQKLIWDIKSGVPTNKWQAMIESNQIKDYVLPESIEKLTKMKMDGVFCFYLPTYDDENSPTCDFKFPQINQSYVVVNRFNNPFGRPLTHYIVVTPDCYFHKPCSGGKLNTSYNILHKTRLDERKVINENNEITINGRKIKIINSNSHYNPSPTIIPTSNKCRYYCKCNATSDDQEIDSIYNVTNIFTDTDSTGCNDCLERANKHCKTINDSCEPYLMDKCSGTNNYTDNEGVIIKRKGGTKTNINTDTSTGNPIYGEDGVNPYVSGGQPGQSSDDEDKIITYDCIDGSCLRVAGSLGQYATLEACERYCTRTDNQPTTGLETESESDKDREDRSNVGSDLGYAGDDKKEESSGICKPGTYWCETLGGCISNDIPCPKPEKITKK